MAQTHGVEAARGPGPRILPGPRPAAALVLLVLVDVVIGWLNYHASDDVQLVALALILAGFGFTYWRPRWGWLFVLLLWVAVPVSSMLGNANNYHPGGIPPAPLYETTVALLPTAIGAAAGAFGRWGRGRA
jgi:hypothetical protein